MAESSETVTPIQPDRLERLVARVNEALSNYSDKDWNYSRISLQLQHLDKSAGPYALWFDLVDRTTRQGKAELKTATDEISWGVRHTDQLGILEIVSLRVNKALIEASSNEFWGTARPILRVVKKESLLQQGIVNAVWYVVTEVLGEDFDAR
jgi:hypothetical protein